VIPDEFRRQAAFSRRSGTPQLGNVHKEQLMRVQLIPAAVVVLTSCADPTSSPSGGTQATTLDVQTDAVKVWEANAAVYWNGVARSLVATNNSNALLALRGYAAVAVAQYNAAVAAEKGSDRGTHPSVHASIGAASVVVLTYLYPGAASALETRLDEFLAADSWPGNRHTDDAAGEAIGRAVAEQVVARAKTDNFFAPFSGPIPQGPGKWFSAAAPVGATIGQAKTYFLLSGNQFRPTPPPAFGSPEFVAALAEVRQISDTRTPEQEANAKFWNFPLGTYQPPGYWNDEATSLAVKYHLGERETAHVMALMHMVGYDALVGSHEAKYFYWLLRPTMADPAITTSIPVPNFPSYPSNHAAISAGMARVLGDRFPAEKKRLDGLAEDAAMSRVRGGIHYWFDGVAGLELGRRVAAWGLAHDVAGHEPFVLR